MNISCEVIKDLLPLYHDGVCSNESKALIEEHFAHCPNCKSESPHHHFKWWYAELRPYKGLKTSNH